MKYLAAIYHVMNRATVKGPVRGDYRLGLAD
jgi:hypothetical protein